MWSDPVKLSDYSSAPREIGVYLIGELSEVAPLTEREKQDSFLGENWTDGFFPHYIGISSELRRGVRARLSAHARRKGNRKIADMISNNVDLYFVCDTGDASKLLSESTLLASLGGGALSCNIRIEYLYSQKRIHDLVHKYYSNIARQSCF